MSIKAVASQQKYHPSWSVFAIQVKLLLSEVLSLKLREHKPASIIIGSSNTWNSKQESNGIEVQIPRSWYSEYVPSLIRPLLRQCILYHLPDLLFCCVLLNLSYEPWVLGAVAITLRSIPESCIYFHGQTLLQKIIILKCSGIQW